MVKVYAQALGLETLICSSDDYFRGRHGFRFDPTDLDNARQYCIQWLRCALFRHVSVVVVDDQHITAAEWEPVLAEARLHQVVFVNFVCPTMELAQQQIARAFTHRTYDDQAMLPAMFQAFQDAQLPDHIDVSPRFNTWDFNTEDMNRNA